MTNLEKYKDEIINFNDEDQDICEEFITKRILSTFGYTDCDEVTCDKCRMLQMIWLQEEYEEPKDPEVDWSNVEVDTPIYVRSYDSDNWTPRYFAYFRNGKVYAWVHGATSWTNTDKDDVVGWSHAKLATQMNDDSR